MNVKNYGLWFMVCDRGLRGPETRGHCCDIIDLYITVLIYNDDDLNL